MSKLLFSAAIFFSALFSNPAMAGQQALSTLLGNGQLLIGTHAQCEPYQSDSQELSAAQTLSQDIARVLADISGKRLGVESSCEPVPNNGKLCKVIFSVNEGELEWARVYQFTRDAGTLGSEKLVNLKCFNLP